jgi:hypothetical protein
MLDGQSFQPDEILVQERLQMIDYSSGTDTSELWELDGLPDHHIQLMITRLIDSPVGQLRSLPRIRLQGSNVCDTGGVFRAKINETFDYLLRQSDLFTLNQVSRRYSFTPHSHVSLQRKRRQYQVFGKILYWFVIIHEQIPYPTDLDSSVLAFCIYGYIPLDLSELENPAFANVAKQIRQLNITSNASLIPLSKDIHDWLYEFEITQKEFTQKLQDPEQGPEVVACQLGTTALLGHCTEQYNWVAEGFKGDITLPESVDSDLVEDLTVETVIVGIHFALFPSDHF